MNNFLIKVRLKLGMMEFRTKHKFLPRGVCKNCKQDIFWIKILGRAKVQATHVKDNEYIDHSICCPTVLAFEERLRMKELKKSKKIFKPNQTIKALGTKEEFEKKDFDQKCPIPYDELTSEEQQQIK